MKHVSTPYDSSIKLKKNLSKGFSSHKYSQSMVLDCIWQTSLGLSDIAYAVGRLESNWEI